MKFVHGSILLLQVINFSGRIQSNPGAKQDAKPSQVGSTPGAGQGKERVTHCRSCTMMGEAFYNGATDVIVVKRSDGSYAATPFHAQIGKVHSLFTSREGKTIHIFVNNIPSQARMEVCDSGSFAFLGSSPHHLASSELAQLNLKPGPNKGKYVSEELKISMEFTVFLFDQKDKLVLSDVDGTITESDVKGHVLPRLGLSAEHSKVVELFHKIAERGYKMVYLTARSHAQDTETRDYLFKMLQNVEGYAIPFGPVLFSPESMMSSLVTEVVTSTPDKQKTLTIEDIWRTFESKEQDKISNTVVMAYGNKETDMKAYVNAGIQKDKVYIVDTSSVLRNAETGEETSYDEQAKIVDQLFPKVN